MTVGASAARERDFRHLPNDSFRKASGVETDRKNKPGCHCGSSLVVDPLPPPGVRAGGVTFKSTGASERAAVAGAGKAVFRLVSKEDKVCDCTSVFGRGQMRGEERSPGARGPLCHSVFTERLFGEASQSVSSSIQAEPTRHWLATA